MLARMPDRSSSLARPIEKITGQSGFNDVPIVRVLQATYCCAWGVLWGVCDGECEDEDFVGNMERVLT